MDDESHVSKWGMGFRLNAAKGLELAEAALGALGMVEKCC